jgi:hypothetical protein
MYRRHRRICYRGCFRIRCYWQTMADWDRKSRYTDRDWRKAGQLPVSQGVIAEQYYFHKICGKLKEKWVFNRLNILIERYFWPICLKDVQWFLHTSYSDLFKLSMNSKFLLKYRINRISKVSSSDPLEYSLLTLIPKLTFPNESFFLANDKLSCRNQTSPKLALAPRNMMISQEKDCYKPGTSEFGRKPHFSELSFSTRLFLKMRTGSCCGGG